MNTSFRRTEVLGAGLAALIGLTACGSYAPRGSSKTYKEGYRYGCYRGYDRAGYIECGDLLKNPPKYPQNKEWVEAWHAGFEECFSRGVGRRPGA